MLSGDKLSSSTLRAASALSLQCERSETFKLKISDREALKGARRRDALPIASGSFKFKGSQGDREYWPGLKAVRKTNFHVSDEPD